MNTPPDSPLPTDALNSEKSSLESQTELQGNAGTTDPLQSALEAPPSAAADAAAAVAANITAGVPDAPAESATVPADIPAEIPPTESLTESPKDPSHAAPEEEKTDEEKKGARAQLERVNRYIKQKKSFFKELSLPFVGVLSKDKPTSQMSLFFLLSLLGFFGVSGVMMKRHMDANEIARMQESKLAMIAASEIAKKTSEEERLRASTVTLGRFTLELKSIPGQKPGVGVVNMAEAEIVILCNDPETKSYFDRNLTAARSQLSSVLVAMDREELLSHDGKKKWRNMLMNTLNQWLPEGEVTDLYFSKLIIN